VDVGAGLLSREQARRQTRPNQTNPNQTLRASPDLPGLLAASRGQLTRRAALPRLARAPRREPSLPSQVLAAVEACTPEQLPGGLLAPAAVRVLLVRLSALAEQGARGDGFRSRGAQARPCPSRGARVGRRRCGRLRALPLRVAARRRCRLTRCCAQGVALTESARHGVDTTAGLTPNSPERTLNSLVAVSPVAFARTPSSESLQAHDEFARAYELGSLVFRAPASGGGFAAAKPQRRPMSSHLRPTRGAGLDPRYVQRAFKTHGIGVVGGLALRASRERSADSCK
jgi:hypothetical protein